MKGDVVTGPDGERIVLEDVGQHVLIDLPQVRVWDIGLAPDEAQHWHHHHNPYVILSLEASPGRMDWLDGSPARYVDEYVGGSVYRGTGPVHRLTNVGDRQYRNRLVELKELGENRESPADVGAGERSVQGVRPPGGPLADGREFVLVHPHTTVWIVELPARTVRTLELAPVPHVLAALEPAPLEQDPSGGVRFHPGGPLSLDNPADEPAAWFVVELTHLSTGEPVRDRTSTKETDHE